MLLFVLGLALRAFVQTSPSPAPPPVASPEIGVDRRVTFRLRAPKATEVLLGRDGARQAMRREDDGVWSLTTEPLSADDYAYRFFIDGLPILDPSNPAAWTGAGVQFSLLRVPGDSAPWDLRDVPHGTLHRHYFKSAVVGDTRDFFVYTPPGYDATGSRRYPVLYLLHGMGGNAEMWSSRLLTAHLVLDNAIAEGRATPMVVVMPLAYGAPEIVLVSPPRPPELEDRNRRRFRESLLSEVIPQVERAYRVTADPGSRAIAGFSMGATESLFVGLADTDRFAWIGAFSAGLPDAPGQMESLFDTADAGLSSHLRLLWMACGTDDPLIGGNRRLSAWLKARGVRHTYVETPGAHTPRVWRRNLAAFVPLLFQPHGPGDPR